MIIKALAGEPLPVYGDGQNVRDWLYVEDHARALRWSSSAARSARPTTSAAAPSAPTWTWSRAICDLLDDRRAALGRLATRA